MSSEYCRYRTPVDKSESRNGSGIEAKIGIELAGRPGENRMAMIASGGSGLRQTFENGACRLLTAKDMGLVKCRQPECNEHTCPDIAYLRPGS